VTLGELGSASDKAREGVQTAVADALRASLKRERAPGSGASEASSELAACSESEGVGGVVKKGSQGEQKPSMGRSWDVLCGLGDGEESGSESG